MRVGKLTIAGVVALVAGAAALWLVHDPARKPSKLRAPTDSAQELAELRGQMEQMQRRLTYSELARDNAAANAIAAETIVLDVTADAQGFASHGLSPDSVDVVLMNPPFNDPARHRGSPDRLRHTAHVATEETLHAWVHAARRMLRSNGVLTLIWRADGIADVLEALSRGFGSLAILPVHGEAGRPAIRVLVRAVKGGRAPTRLLPGLMLNDEARVSKNEMMEILEGRAALPLMEP